MATAYKEETWGKDVEGEYVIDGFKFIGKIGFKKAIEGLTDKMIRGAHGDVNRITFTVLDRRPSGTGLDIDIEVIEGKNRGNAMLKLYGQSKKKHGVVLVTKCKGSEAKFTKILALNVIKPLIDKFLESDDIVQSLNSKSFVSVAGKEVKIEKCPFCEKTSYSNSGLKSHITKMHKKEGTRKRQLSESDSVGDHIFAEANKVVGLLVDNMVGDENEESIEDSKEVTLDEMDVDDSNLSKMYSNKCEFCNLKVEAPRRYKVFQMLKQHRELDHNNICEMCCLEVTDTSNMKKHMRDVHSITTASTSPPLKRKRNVPTVDIVELEEMEIDNNDESEILSKRMDEKIEKKAKETEEKEKLYNEKVKKDIENKKQKEEKRKEIEKRKRQQKKQNQKDLRKSSNKKMKKTVENLEKSQIKIPNIKDVPLNIKHLVGEDDVVYKVPGNGACGPNSAAAFLFSDDIFGPKLRRNMNLFMAKHWDSHYQYKTQCTEESPFERKLGNRIISFTKPQELKEYLINSEEASYLWSDSEDLAVIADMFQINIKIITSKSDNDQKPTENWIFPDKEMKQFAELKDVELKDMILFHKNDSHFDLIIDKNDDLATMGSLSHRFNVGPLLEDKEAIEEDEPMIEQEQPKTEDSDYKKYKNELKKCQAMNDKLREDYSKCENELRSKTEEVEKLKTELKLFKKMFELEEEVNCQEKYEEEIVQCVHCVYKCKTKTELNRHVRYKHTDDKREIKEQNKRPIISSESPAEIFNCEYCAYECTSKAQLSNHIKWKHINMESEEEFNCDGCDFQGTTRLQLNKHINIKHVAEEQPKKEVIKCRNCDEQFSEKWNLMNHRKQKHIEKVAYCRKKQEGSCPFSDDKCWWNHENKQQEVKCYVCDKIFQGKSSMMKHRKSEHTSLVRKCDKDLQNNCPFQSNTCWFLHENDMEVEDGQEDNTINETQKQTETLVFRKPPVKQKKE